MAIITPRDCLTGRRTTGLLDARIKKLSANQCAIGRVLGRARCSHDCKCHSLAIRLRAELLGLALRPFGRNPPLPMQLDSFTFRPANATQVALFFNTYGSLYHIRKFSIKVSSNTNTPPPPPSDSEDSDQDEDDDDDASEDDAPKDNRPKDDTAQDTVAQFASLDTAEDIEPYVIAINKLPFLEEISFSGTSIGVWAAYRLAAALRTKTRLRRADFSDVFKGKEAPVLPSALGAIVSALIELPHLESINLSSNALGPQVEWPVLSLIRNCTPLQEIILNDTGMGPEASAEFAKALVDLSVKKAAVGAPPLRKLIYSNNRMCQDDNDPLFGMADWAEAFAAHPRLRVVDLKGNRIKHGGMDLLIPEGLSNLRELEVLDLMDSTFTSEGLTHMALADAIGFWPNLRVLNLNDCLLGSRGAALLVPALAVVQPGSRLEVLKLKANHLSPANTLALSGVLWRLPELREVNLRRNNIAGTDEGYGIIRRLLRERGEQRGFETKLNPINDSPDSTPSQSPTSQCRGSPGSPQSPQPPQPPQQSSP
jgi:Ran GTPase-activating protein 1